MTPHEATLREVLARATDYVAALQSLTPPGAEGEAMASALVDFNEMIWMYRREIGLEHGEVSPAGKPERDSRAEAAE